MSPAPRSLQALVDGVRGHLLRDVGVAAALWVAVAVAGILVVAWLAAGSQGWSQGSDVPAVLDGLILFTVLAGWWAVGAVARRWLKEAELAGAMEEAAGLASGTVRGSLELAREFPVGVSARLAGRAAEGTVERLQRPPSELDRKSVV